MTLVTLEQINEVIALIPEDIPRKPGRPPQKAGQDIDVRAWVEAHLGGVAVVAEKVRKGVTLYVLSECPFNAQHKAPDSAILKFSSGAVSFKCFHNSCQGYDWDTLRARFDPKRDDLINGAGCKGETTQSPADTAGLPVIELRDRQLRDIVTATIDAVVAAGSCREHLLYVRGGSLVRVIRDEDGYPRQDMVSVDSLPEIISRAANFTRASATGCVGVFPPISLAQAIVSLGSWPFPPLRGIVNVPILRSDGTVCDKPGYDAASRLYYHPLGSFPQLPRKSSKGNANAAAKFLLDILSDFPFVDESSRDNAMGLLLTVVIKDMVGLAPLALIDAPTKGTGKTRLAQLAAIAATGRELPLSTEVQDEGEWRKQITSLTIADRPVVIIDNLERTLRSSQLAAVLTTSEWSDRLLGRSEVLHLHSRAIWIATGNNIRLGGDIARRAYWIRLNCNLPMPWMRDPSAFKRELPAWAIEHRNEIVCALLTMVQGWFFAGKPKWSGQSLGSYEAWSCIVGGILEYCGVNHFLKNLESLYEQVDDEQMQWRVFMGQIYRVFGEGTPFSTRCLMDKIFGEKETSQNGNAFESLISVLPDNLGSCDESGFSKRLGIAMRKRRDQIFEIEEGRIKLADSLPDRHRQKPQWKVIKM